MTKHVERNALDEILIHPKGSPLHNRLSVDDETAKEIADEIYKLLEEK